MVAVAAVAAVAGSQDTHMRKRLLAVICAAVFLIGAVSYVYWQMHTPSSTEEQVAEQKILEGRIVCLSKTGPEPHTLECAVGLETTRGDYMLKGLDEHQLSTVATMDQYVIVEGNIVPRSEADSNYAVVGSVRVESIRQR